MENLKKFDQFILESESGKKSHGGNYRKEEGEYKKQNNEDYPREERTIKTTRVKPEPKPEPKLDPVKKVIKKKLKK